uniref:Uncharacterized protein n=1 Tax=Anguilla anguilla TaxID=7936 RepID=A0A0E9PCJ9_ANGAN
MILPWRGNRLRGVLHSGEKACLVPLEVEAFLSNNLYGMIHHYVG